MSLFFTSSLFSQVGINTSSPDSSSNLHVANQGSTIKGTLLSPATTAERNSISSPATGLLVYDTDLRCLMSNNGTPSAPNWQCTTVKGDVAISKHFFYQPNFNTMTVTTAYTTTGVRPSEASNNNMVGYLNNNDPLILSEIPVMDGLRMNVAFYTKGASGTTMSPMIENITGGTITNFVLINQSTVSGVKRVEYRSLANNNYVNIDADGIVYYDTSSFESCVALVNYNGKMYRCTWWGYYGNGTHNIHMTMEVFD